MDGQRVKAYLCSLPERVVRSVAALAAGTVREVTAVALPARVRRSRLYASLVESTLRFFVEQIGQVEGVYPPGSELPKDFLARRTAGNVIEAAGILAFRASPVWVLAALADLSGAGRDLIPEIAEALAQEGLLERGSRFETVDQLLDGLERVTGQLAETVNTPPLDVAALRQEWAKLREAARRRPPAELPPAVTVRTQWRQLQDEAAAQRRSVFDLSAAMALSAVRNLPENARWLSRVAVAGTRRTGQVLAQGLLDHYRTTLADIRQTGYVRYWAREFRPYLAGALRQFSPGRISATERWIKRRNRSQT